MPQTFAIGRITDNDPRLLMTFSQSSGIYFTKINTLLNTSRRCIFTGDVDHFLINITTHYKSEKIVDYFGDGSTFGVNVRYVSEDRPLGTAGALSLLDAPDAPLLVINGDILTRVDYRAMLAYHQHHGAELTVAVKQYEIQVPYGVLKCNGVDIEGVDEKPKLEFLVSAGIYMLQPSACKAIPGGDHFDMTELLEKILEIGGKVVSFPVREYWLDIGQPHDFEQAQDDVMSVKWYE